MAKMIDQKPTLHGEAKLWSCLESYFQQNNSDGRKFETKTHKIF